ncbi:molecular chaperone DnaJ [Patescibacteria group bacterium]|nr:molecular chaperone DnaJ [Patescibacteria group bacterium]
MDYYKTLDVEKGASQDEIKKAFRKKAHVYHPDKKGGDEAKFKEVNEAYQVLGDEKKRSQYDQFGPSFQHGQAGGGAGGSQDFGGFSQGGFTINMDDLGDAFSDFFGGSRTNQRGRRGSDIETIVDIDFREAVFGTEKEINLTKNNQCGYCDGNGVEPGAKIDTCKPCNGSGRVTKIQRTILGQMQVQATCTTCGGDGKTYSQKCTKCSGIGATRGTSKINVKIPAGIDEGQSIRLNGQGEAGQQGAQNGDLYLLIKINSDPDFSREGDTVLSKEYINFSQAALGDKIEIKTVDGALKLKIPEGTQSGTQFRLRGKGVHRLNQRGMFSGIQNIRGDHLVEVIVNTPTKLTRKQKKLLEELDA